MVVYNKCCGVSLGMLTMKSNLQIQTHCTDKSQHLWLRKQTLWKKIWCDAGVCKLHSSTVNVEAASSCFAAALHFALHFNEISPGRRESSSVRNFWRVKLRMYAVQSDNWTNRQKKAASGWTTTTSLYSQGSFVIIKFCGSSTIRHCEAATLNETVMNQHF